MYKISTRLSIGDKEIIQEQYITEHFIILEVNNQEYIYIPGNVFLL